MEFDVNLFKQIRETKEVSAMHVGVKVNEAIKIGDLIDVSYRVSEEDTDEGTFKVVKIDKSGILVKNKYTSMHIGNHRVQKDKKGWFAELEDIIESKVNEKVADNMFSSFEVEPSLKDLALVNKFCVKKGKKYVWTSPQAEQQFQDIYIDELVAEHEERVDSYEWHVIEIDNKNKVVEVEISVELDMDEAKVNEAVDVSLMKKWLDDSGIAVDQYAEDKYNPTTKEIITGYKYFKNGAGKVLLSNESKVNESSWFAKEKLAKMKARLAKVQQLYKKYPKDSEKYEREGVSLENDIEQLEKKIADIKRDIKAVAEAKESEVEVRDGVKYVKPESFSLKGVSFDTKEVEEAKVEEAARSPKTAYVYQVADIIGKEPRFIDLTAAGYRVKLWVPDSNDAGAKQIAALQAKVDKANLPYPVRFKLAGWSPAGGDVRWVCYIVPVAVNEATIADPITTPTTEPATKPRTPLAPQPGVSPKPKALASNNDVKLFKQAREAKVQETSVSDGPEKCKKCQAKIGTKVSDNFNGLCPECYEEKGK